MPISTINANPKQAPRAHANRRIQLLIVVLMPLTIAAAVSHALIAHLRIETSAGKHWELGASRHGKSILLAGSSLAGDGISWPRVSATLNRRIEGWGVAGSSPAEWEHFQSAATNAGDTILVVSPYDLNESYLSDFRANIVPLSVSARDLWASGADWPSAKRLLSAYPLQYLRLAFPTAGRSEGVIVGVREELSRLTSNLALSEQSNVEARPTLSFGDTSVSYKTEKIADWSEARLLRRLTELRGASQGQHAFSGPKQLAFRRMLQRGVAQGGVVVIVLPVSPPYTKEFLTPSAKTEYEKALNEAQATAPAAKWIRLDGIAALHSTDNFWDLVHMNVYGQTIATEALLAELVPTK